eukprot:RCo027740
MNPIDSGGEIPMPATAYATTLPAASNPPIYTLRSGSPFPPQYQAPRYDGVSTLQPQDVQLVVPSTTRPAQQMPYGKYEYYAGPDVAPATASAPVIPATVVPGPTPSMLRSLSVPPGPLELLPPCPPSVTAAGIGAGPVLLAPEAMIDPGVVDPEGARLERAVPERDPRRWSREEVLRWVSETVQARFPSPEVVNRTVGSFAAHMVDGRTLRDLKPCEWADLVPEVAVRKHLVAARDKLFRSWGSLVTNLQLLLEVATVLLLGIAFVLAVIATSYSGWALSNYNGQHTLGLWKECSCDTNPLQLCTCTSVGNALPNGSCSGLLNVVRAFSVLGIIFSGFTALFAHAVARRGKGYYWRRSISRLALMTWAFMLVTWAVFIPTKSCESGLSYGASFGLQIGAFCLALFGNLAAWIVQLMHYKDRHHSSNAFGTPTPEAQGLLDHALDPRRVRRGFKITVLVLVGTALVLAIVATATTGWITKGPASGTQLGVGLWQVCSCNGTAGGVCGCNPVSSGLMATGSCGAYYQVARAFSIMGIVVLGVSFLIAVWDLWRGIAHQWRAVNVGLQVFASVFTLICWAVFTGFPGCLPLSSAWSYNYSFGLQVGAFGICIFAIIATILLYLIPPAE